MLPVCFAPYFTLHTQFKTAYIHVHVCHEVALGADTDMRRALWAGLKRPTKCESFSSVFLDKTFWGVGDTRADSTAIVGVEHCDCQLGQCHVMARNVAEGMKTPVIIGMFDGTTDSIQIRALPDLIIKHCQDILG